MKLKILITPVVIIIAVIATAGIILPKAFEAKDVLEKQKKSQQDLTQASDKIDKANRLSQELAVNTEKQNILLRYIPVDKQEEGLINNLDAIASAEGLAIVKLSPVTKAASTVSIAPENSGEDIPGGADSSQLSAGKIKTTDVDVTVIGSYEKTKSFLEKLKGMQRFNEVVSLEISKMVNTDNPDQNNLQTKMVLGFGYLDRVTVASINSEILNSGKFNISTIEKIKNSAKTGFSEINIGQTGKTNPFIP